MVKATPIHIQTPIMMIRLRTSYSAELSHYDVRDDGTLLSYAGKFLIGYVWFHLELGSIDSRSHGHGSRMKGGAGLGRRYWEASLANVNNQIDE